MQIVPTAEYQITLSEKEFTMVTRALGLMAGVGVVVKDGDPEEAAELSRRFLEQQRSFYKDRLQNVESKLARKPTTGTVGTVREHTCGQSDDICDACEDALKGR